MSDDPMVNLKSDIEHLKSRQFILQDNFRLFAVIVGSILLMLLCYLTFHP